MWKVERNKKIGPHKYEWIVIHTAYGAWLGYAWTKRGAYRKLKKAERKLLSS